jgi:hypothetical protein
MGLVLSVQDAFTMFVHKNLIAQFCQSLFSNLFEMRDLRGLQSIVPVLVQFVNSGDMICMDGIYLTEKRFREACSWDVSSNT